jgi:hypothetical protein
MNVSRAFIFAALSVSAALVASSASARTICRPDGVCFNTSGKPIPPWKQPAYEGGYAYDAYPYHRHWHRDYY